MADKKPKIDLDEQAFAEGADALPVITGKVEYTEDELVLKIPLAEFTYRNSRATTKGTRRSFAVKGDMDREGIPGYIKLRTGNDLSVTFSNPSMFLFFSPSKA